MKRLMGSVFIIALLMTGVAQAQDGEKSSWIPTKGVQKIANKKLYSSEELRASHVEAKSAAIPAQVVSKQVQRVSNPAIVDGPAEGNVASKGYPEWIISKGVHRNGRK